MHLQQLISGQQGGLLQALQHHRSDLVPRPLHGRITEQLGADGIGGELQRMLAELAPQQRRQIPGQGGLAAGGRADQQVTAQRDWVMGASWAGKGDLRVLYCEERPTRQRIPAQRQCHGRASTAQPLPSPSTIKRRP